MPILHSLHLHVKQWASQQVSNGSLIVFNEEEIRMVAKCKISFISGLLFIHRMRSDKIHSKIFLSLLWNFDFLTLKITLNVISKMNCLTHLISIFILKHIRRHEDFLTTYCFLRWTSYIHSIHSYSNL